MGSMNQHCRVVECHTIDGVKLEAWLYEVAGPAPAIIMTHGMNCVKEMSLDETAEAFHAAGYNVLLYDCRSVGGSEGNPRNQIDPVQMSQDVSDVVSYVLTLPSVNPREIMLWGMSMGAALSGVAATIDTRIAALVMVCPLFSYIRADKRRTLFPKLMKDRQSQLRGNAPLELPPFNGKGENPAGFGGSGGPGGREAALLMRSAIEHGHPTFRDRITLQSYHKLALFRPKELLRDLLRVPTLMVIPERDDISPPAEQREVFETLAGPKKLHWACGEGHMSILSAKDAVNIRKEMISFFNSARGSGVEAQGA